MERLCVIFGGASTEHDISIITGMQLAKNLESKYKVEKIYLDLNNNFYLASSVDDIAFFQDKEAIKLKSIIISNGAIYLKNLLLKKYCNITCVINCCHGGVGEDGDLSGFFNINKIPCTSAPALASHIAMDKNLTKILVGNLVPTIKGELVTLQNRAKQIEKIKSEFADDLIVKPNALGSSIGVKACNKDDFIQQIDAIFALNDSALVEERITDLAEYNQACFIDNGKLILSAIENPISKSAFLTFDEKYTAPKSKGQDRIIPAKISIKLKKQICDYTQKIYTALNMNGVARIDYIYDKANAKLYFNEINTIPGSMAFYLYEDLGIDYITLIEKLIANATKPQKFSYFKTDVLNKKI